MKQISIIVPVYNTKEEYLRKCINSLIAQTIYNEIEIIIVDDGSKEQCAKICDEYSSKYENIKVIHQENQGLSVSRNNGMKVAQGKWIMFVDSDDWVENDICEKLLEEDKEDVDIVISSCNNCYKDKIEKVTMFGGQDKKWAEDKEELELRIISRYILGKESLNSQYLTVAWAKLYKKSFIEKYQLYDICKLRFREDNIFNLYCFENARKIVYKDCYLYNYRQCKNSLMHQNNWNKIEQYLEYLKEEKKFIDKYNKDFKFYDAYKIRLLQSATEIIGKYIFKRKCGYLEKVEKTKEIIKRKEFEDAINNVNGMYLGKYLKIMNFLLKKKMYGTISVLYNLREMIKGENRKKLYE